MQTAGIFKRTLIQGEFTVIDSELVSAVIQNERNRTTLTPDPKTLLRWRREDWTRKRRYSESAEAAIRTEKRNEKTRAAILRGGNGNANL